MTNLTVADDSLFGTDNLPYGVYKVGGQPPRVATRLGDQVIDLGVLLGESGDDAVFGEPSLNAFMAQGYERWVEVRKRVKAAVVGDVPADAVHGIDEVTLLLPIEVADYVDFFASETHASNCGLIFRPGADPLMPNWKHLPVSYHGRAASVVVSGTDVVRPSGQRRGEEGPVFGPSIRLDIETELGFVVGTGNRMGEPIPVDDAERHIFGAVVFNDWSARDIQNWEYQPLGPNLGKSFASTISPWIVPLLALRAARVDTPVQDPPVLPYLSLERPWGLDIDFEVEWNGEIVSRPRYAEIYWSPAQMLAHMTVNGAPSRTGDLFASGTISGPERNQRGSFLELSWGGTEPVSVAGQARTFIEDGDEIVLRATAVGAGGKRIGFGEARGRIVPRPE